MSSKNKPLHLKKKAGILTGHPDTEVKVALQKDDKTNEFWLLVSVGSNIRPGLWGHKKVDPNNAKTKIEYDVKRAAEQIAVFQMSTYRDIHDIFAVGRAAVEAMHDVFAQADRASRKVISIPSKAK